jgi:steroid 5-alpha reductase family enzyme
MDWSLWPYGLIPLTVMALAGWLYSLPRENVNLVDTLWSLFFLAATLLYAAMGQGTRAGLLVALVGLWAARLSIHLAMRNHGKPEDRRYQAIRANNSPGFGWKSLYIVFGLQAVLAWLISLPLFVAATSSAPRNGLDAVGIALMLAGLLFEAAADRQLTAFKARPENRGRVLDTGLWAWSRHPNYFGEACVWFGFGLIGVAAGSLWSLLAPLIMTALLLKVSGVSLLEKDIAERRPAYRDYVARTSAFIPWPPRARAGQTREVA